MSSKSPNVRLTLTAEQREAIKQATGKNAEAIELSVEELEERVAPMKSPTRLV